MTDPDWADATYLEPLDADAVAADHRAGAAGRAAADPRRPDRAQPRGRARGGGVLDRFGVELIGAPLEAIRRAEDRQEFREAVTAAGLAVPESVVVRSLDELAEGFAPAVVRPAFTLGGSGGGLARSEEELRRRVELGLAPQPDRRGARRALGRGLAGVRARGDVRSRPGTASSSARSRTSTRWASTRATRGRSPRSRRCRTSSTSACARRRSPARARSASRRAARTSSSPTSRRRASSS